MARISWEPLEHFGALVDLDLSETASEQQIAELRALFDLHQLLLFRNQKLSYDDQLEVSGWFGPAAREKAPSILSPALGVMGLGSNDLGFHSDLACTNEPLDALSLYALEVDEGKTSTLFADAVAAASRLPEALQRRIRGLSVLNLWPTFDNSPVWKRDAVIPGDWPGAVHPLLLTHPRTGAELLYLNASHSERILGLSPEESEELMKTLFACFYDEAFVLEHRWRNGDLVIWDNLAVQHGRRTIPPGTTRRLQRVAIGTEPHGKNMPAEYAKAFELS
jgi:taurine dioxygenase